MSIPKAGLRCSRCGNTDERKFQWKGTRRGKKKYWCKRCGAWGQLGEAHQYNYTYSNRGDFAEVTIETERRIRTEKDLIEVLGLDMTEWHIDRFVVGKSEGYRKDRRVEWRVRDGQVVSGDVHDTGKLLIEPLYSVKVWLRRRTQEIRSQLAVTDLKQDLGRFAYRYKKIRYPRLREGLLFEIEMPDIHLGKLTWGEESGENSDLKTQTQRVLDTIKTLLSYARHYPIDRILLPIGNDYFNVDNLRDETTEGTPQQEDTRWRKTFRAGRTLAVQMIDLCSQIAPVDVLVVPGNHDQERSFYLGCALEAWYHKNPNVTVDNSARSRKYFVYGTNLIGFTHGHSQKPDALAHIMSEEAAQLWATSRVREWHVGHLHHKEDTFLRTFEGKGVTVRILRSLTPVDAWHYERGYIFAAQASEAFLWDRKRGLVAQFTAAATPNKEQL